MKIITKNKISTLIILFAMVFFTSCLKEDRDNCGGVDIKFNFSYNILNSNAFGEQADKVSLYVFDEDGLLVRQITDEGDRVTNDFQISLTGLRDGKYQFAAWAQSTNVEGDLANFEISELTVGQSTINELTAYLKRANGHQQHELNYFLIGCKTSEIVNRAGRQLVTIDLRKVTNKFRVILFPAVESIALNADNYDFTITDNTGNGHINYDYSLLEDDAVAYKPYFKAIATPKQDETLNDGSVQSAVIAELNTSRLMAAHKPRLVVNNNITGDKILDINLSFYLELTELESHSAEWSLQEYLDRQDEYSISMFINPGTGTWLKTVIIINGWVINLDEIDL